MELNEQAQHLTDTPWIKLFAGIVPLIGQVFTWNVWMTERSRWTRAAWNRLHSLGPLYVWVYWLPHRIIQGLFFLLIVYAIVVAITGAWELTAPPPPSWLAQVTGPYPWFVVGFLITVALAISNAVPRVLLFVMGRICDFRFRPGWVNADWHVRSGKDAIPITVDADACARVADQILTGITQGGIRGDEDKARKPTGLDEVALANALFFGTFIEHNLYQLKKSEGIRLSEFYAHLFEAQRIRGVFSPEALRRSVRLEKGLYEALRQTASGFPMFPDSAELAQRVQRLARELYDYDRDMNVHSLAIGGFWYKYQSVARANRRLRRFSGFRESSSIRGLFLKLALDMGVWRTDPGPFVYGFSKNVTRTLLLTDCLATRLEDETIAIDDNLRDLSAWAMKAIVEQVYRLMLFQADAGTVQRYCQETFNCSPSQVVFWSVAREVDYLIWHYSRIGDPRPLVGELPGSWKVVGNTFKRAKAPTAAVEMVREG